MKPYLKLAWTLLVIGGALMAFERYALPEIAGRGKLELGSDLLAILVIAPFVLILAGAVVFMYGKLRRL